MKSSLETVLKYENPDVVDKFLKQFPVKQEDAVEIFEETKKWLWFAANTDIPRPGIDVSLRIIDEMWHTFLVFTADYTEFCSTYFDKFLHHAPTTEAERIAIRAKRRDNPSSLIAEEVESMENQYRSVLKLLGEETLHRWYVEYPRRYSLEACRSLAAKSLANAAERDERVSLNRSLATDLSQADQSTSLVDRLVINFKYQTQYIVTECGGVLTCNKLGCIFT